MVTAGPARATAAGLVAGGLSLGVLGLLLGDTGGRVLALPAALVAVALGLRDLLLRPVLRADRTGLEVVTGLRRLHLAWADIARLRVVRDRRTPLLEIDLGDDVIVLGRLRLARPPDAVLAELLAVQDRER